MSESPLPPNWLATTRNARNAHAREGRAASGAQLWRLNRLGLLALCEPRGSPILAALAFELLARAKEEGRW